MPGNLSTKPFSGKVVIVTGAEQGIGAATAKDRKDQCARIHICFRNVALRLLFLSEYLLHQCLVDLIQD
tara:strand:- start:347 stop:553 length:207 start_codon:yes stop_codon:yes gene_type:complete